MQVLHLTPLNGNVSWQTKDGLALTVINIYSIKNLSSEYILYTNHKDGVNVGANMYLIIEDKCTNGEFHLAVGGQM